MLNDVWLPVLKHTWVLHWLCKWNVVLKLKNEKHSSNKGYGIHIQGCWVLVTNIHNGNTKYRYSFIVVSCPMSKVSLVVFFNNPLKPFSVTLAKNTSEIRGKDVVKCLQTITNHNTVLTYLITLELRMTWNSITAGSLVHMLGTMRYPTEVPGCPALVKRVSGSHLNEIWFCYPIYHFTMLYWLKQPLGKVR